MTMRLTSGILVSLSTFIIPAFTSPQTPPVPSRLNITTIAASKAISMLECWQLSAPFVQSSQAGTSGAAIAQLGLTGATSYSVLPPQFDGGLHNAPAVQYVQYSSFPSPCPRLSRLLPFASRSLVRSNEELIPFLRESQMGSFHIRPRRCLSPKLNRDSHHPWWPQWVNPSNGYEERQRARAQNGVSE